MEHTLNKDCKNPSSYLLFNSMPVLKSLHLEFLVNFLLSDSFSFSIWHFPLCLSSDINVWISYFWLPLETKGFSFFFLAFYTCYFSLDEFLLLLFVTHGLSLLPHIQTPWNWERRREVILNWFSHKHPYNMRFWLPLNTGQRVEHYI